MRLILFRHGIAEPCRDGLNDADRRLTPEGIEKTRLAARGLASLYQPIDTVLTSPKVRAQQTAELLGETLNQPIETCEELAYGSVAQIIKMVRKRSEGVLVLVGHEPTFSMIGETLCTDHAPAFIELKKAGAIVLRLEPSENKTPAVLEALLTPRSLRAVGQPINE